MERLRNSSWLYVLTFLALACKPQSEQSTVSSSKKLPIERHYENAFKNGDLRQALNIACTRYGLQGCEDMHVKNKESPFHKATTSQAWLGNYITLYRNAFEFRGQPHMGWLAAIIRHEQVHQNQSGYIRWVQTPQGRVLGDYTFVAGLEIEAWEEMLKYEQVYDLSCHQIMDIEENLYQYHRILRADGRKVDDQKTLPLNQYQALMSRCLERKKIRYEASKKGLTGSAVLP